jgi:hypothetical protein
MGFMTLLSGLLVSIFETQTDSIETARIEQDGHYIFAELNYEISHSLEIIEPSELGENRQDLVINSDGSEITFSIQNDSLVISQNSVAENLSSPDIKVSDLNFEKIGNDNGVDSVRISFNLLSTSSSPKIKHQSYVLTIKR